MKKLIFIILLLLILNTGHASAQQAGQVVINSADWRDVYSAVAYANYKDIPYYFAISEPHARVIPKYLDKNLEVQLFESESVPYLVNYKNILEQAGSIVVDETRSASGRELNLKLASELDINNFIIVDDQYGYNAISAAPYAAKSGSWVLFADRDNIDEVNDFLNSRNVENVLIYGHVDKAVKDELNGFNPEIIDEGNRFENNIVIVSKFMELSPTDSVILSNGEFIEGAIMEGNSPVIFIGVNTVPAQVIEFVKSSNIKGGTLIGNELVGSGQDLKEATGISVIVKFGQGRQVTGEMSLVEDLDKFYLPRYELSLDAISAQYNEATKQLEIIYRNDANIGEFFKSSVGIMAIDERVGTVGDDDAPYIESGSDSGRAYDIDLTAYARTSNLSVIVTSEFGEAPGSLNLLLTKVLDITLISVEDDSKISVSNVNYDKRTQRLELAVENTGNIPCYASPSITILIEGDEEVVRLGNSIPLEAGEKQTVSTRVELTNADLADNPDVPVHVDYGERSELLVKNLDEVLPLNVTGGISTGLLLAILALLLIIAAAVVWSKRKPDAGAKTDAKPVICSNCGESIPVDAQFCPKCGSVVEKE
ncbi:MAG: zinc ribbon domain-containing protein [Methanosarcinales archaeon]|nr:zinc ribbon domain-containing protein [Methanosarcinales archaeon]